MKQLSVDEIQECAIMADIVMSEHVKTEGFKGQPAGSLSDVFRDLRVRGLPWVQILAKLAPILALLFGGGDIGDIMKKILELFNLTA